MKLLSILLATLAFTGLGLAATNQASDVDPKDQAIIDAQLPSYPVEVCVLTEQPFSEKKPARNVVVNGRLIRVCCPKCEKMVQDDPKDALAKLDAAVVKAQKDSYPLKTCAVLGGELGGMGEPVDYVYGTRLVRFCCKGCIPKFEKDPAKYMAVVDKALIAEQTKTYPVDTCVVGGGKLGDMGDPVDYLYGTRLVRFCCKGCVPKFQKEPAKYLAMLDAAKKK